MLQKNKMGFEWGENLLSKFPARVNSGHPLFIGEGRTGEIAGRGRQTPRKLRLPSPYQGAETHFLRHVKPKPFFWFGFFVCISNGI